MVASARSRQVEREAIDRVMSGRTLLPWVLLLAVSWSGATSETTTPKPKHPATHQPTHAAASGKAHRPNSHVRHVKTHRKPRSARSIARSRKLQRAFVASSQLRPMAQELATMRSPAAYAGSLPMPAPTPEKQRPRPTWPWDTPTCWTTATPTPQPASRKQIPWARPWTTTPIFSLPRR